VFVVEDVHFYSTADEYGDFSNFAAYVIRLDGELWPTSEHMLGRILMEVRADLSP